MPQIKTAMLLAAGLGTRMRPLSEKTPKPLIEVAGRTLIDRLIDKLVAAGFEKAVVNAHYLADQLEAHMKRHVDIEIAISDERDLLLETGGGVVKAAPMLGNEPVLILNTDSCWLDENDTTFTDLIDQFDEARMDALLLLARRDHSMGYDGQGDFFLDEEGRLVRRGDKPESPYAFAGAYIMNPCLVSDRKIEPFSANVYWNESLAKGRLYGAVMQPYWMHVGDPQSRDKAEEFLYEVEDSAGEV